MARIPQSQDDLVAHLADHRGFLIASANAFDGGQTGEAKRLATSLRVLLHDTAMSHSLLGQLKLLGGRFISTALPHEPRNVGSHGGLVMIAASKGGSTYYAPLDKGLSRRWLPFSDWWNEIVFVDGQRNTLSRKDLILAVANQDGGAHVDPHLNDAYGKLSRNNSMGWVEQPGGIPIPNAERAAVRQNAHEVLVTLLPTYRKKPTIEADMFFGGAMLVEGNKAPSAPRPEKIGRNELCPCGSGAKYKKCHGAI